MLRRGGRRGARPASEGVDVVAERESALHTLDVWDSHLAQVGSQLLYARLRLLRDLGPYLGKAYDEVSAGQSDARVHYKSRCGSRPPPGSPTVRCPRRRSCAPNPGVAGRGARRGGGAGGEPGRAQRDDVVLTLGELPAKGYASHGESWSFALGLKLAAYRLLLTTWRLPGAGARRRVRRARLGRRGRLAAMIADCEQVVITAAVPEDVPAELMGRTFMVTRGSVVERE